MFTTPVKATRTARKRGRLAAVAIGLASAASLALAPAASAAPGENGSIGLRCGGLVTCGPFAQSSYPGNATNTFAGANVAGLVSTGVINTTANAGGATASVADVNAILSGLSTLTATAVSSQCTVGSDTNPAATGSSSIVGGSIAVLAGSPVTLATAPAPNTRVTVVDPAIASVVLNRQRTATDGTLTVDAIFIRLANLQTITIATSTCGVPKLPVPMVAPAVAIGGGAAAVLAVPVLGVLWYRRRQGTDAAARA